MPDLVILTGDSEVNLAPGATVELAAGSEVTLANQPITATVSGTVTATICQYHCSAIHQAQAHCHNYPVG